MAVVAIHVSRRGRFIADEPAGAPGTRPLPETAELDNAKRFADQTAINSYVSGRGNSSDWVAMLIP